MNYIGTIPESPVTTNPNPALWTITANPLSRHQPTDVVANQSEATYKFDTCGWKHTAVAGVEVSREISSIDSYTEFDFGRHCGLASTRALTGVSESCFRRQI